MDLQRLFSDYGVPHITEGHKHTTSNGDWVNVHCPFCQGSTDFHLGVSASGGANCWRCGSHSLKATISALLGIPENKVFHTLKPYQNKGIIPQKAPEAKVSIKPFRYPNPNEPILTKPYARYLKQRGFNPKKLAREWGIFQTGPVSLLDGIAYSYRIIIPIVWNGEAVSFQGRDITGKSELKYLACPKEREIFHHKTILYGKQEAWGEVGVVVEGVTDVWRLGPGSVATFGIKYKMEQVLALSKAPFQRIIILFDHEPQAQVQAKSLAVKLRALGKKVFVETIPDDPGSLDQKDADHLMKNLIRKGR